MHQYHVLHKGAEEDRSAPMVAVDVEAMVWDDDARDRVLKTVTVERFAVVEGYDQAYCVCGARGPRIAHSVRAKPLQEWFEQHLDETAAG